MAKRPKPIHLGWARATVARGPRPDGRHYWRVRTTLNRTTAATGWWTEAEAEVAVATLVAAGPAPRPSVSVAAPETLDDLLDDWLVVQQRRAAARRDSGGDRSVGISEGSLKVYTRMVKHWRAEGIARLPLTNVTREAIEDVVLSWQGQRVSARYVATHTKVLGAALRWGARRNLVRVPDLRGVRPVPDGYVYNDHTPTPGEASRAIAAIERIEYRDVLTLQAATGARVHEVTQLQAAAWDPERRELSLESGKTGARIVPVTGRAAAMLTRRFDAGTDTLFRLPKTARAHVNDHLKMGGIKTGVTVFTSHGLRRLAVNRLLDAGADPKVISLITGHSVHTLLTIYRRPTASQLRQAVENAGLGSLPQGEIISFRAQIPGTGDE